MDHACGIHHRFPRNRPLSALGATDFVAMEFIPSKTKNAAWHFEKAGHLFLIFAEIDPFPKVKISVQQNLSCLRHSNIDFWRNLSFPRIKILGYKMDHAYGIHHRFPRNRPLSALGATDFVAPEFIPVNA